MVGRNSSDQEQKFIYLARATHGYKKTKDFTEYLRGEISGNQGFQVREASYLCYYAPSGRNSLYFGLFYALRAVWFVFFPKGCWGSKN